MRPADNPFAAHRLDTIRYRPQGAGWPETLARLEDLGFRAAVVGGHGTGKTAFLDELASLLGERGQPTYLARARAGWARTWNRLRSAAADRSAVLLLDSAELVSALEWPLVLRQARQWRGCVVTAHREGRLPTLLRCSTSPGLLAELVAELAPGAGIEEAVSLADLWAANRGDLRACLLALYDHCAGRLP